jgi:hypothetical protein
VERGGDAGDGKSFLEPLRFTLRDVILLLHRAGVSYREASEERPAFEVRVLLMDQVAQLEARRRETEGGEEEREPLNPPDAPAPSWVDDLDGDD